MPRQSDRYALDVTVELYASHTWRRVTVQDVSCTGMFLVTAPLPLGTPVIVALISNGSRVACPARVTHCLSEADARVLGRAPGIGIAFREPQDESFAIAIEGLLQRARTKQPQHSHIVVADRQSRMLERLSAALGSAGFSVATASSGMEVFGACLRQIPDVVVVDRATPIIDAFQLIERFACDDKLSAVPIVVMTNEPSDLGPAFARGAADVILKPFTMLELIARTSRVAQSPRRAETVLAGSLAEFELAALLTLLEQQRKSGRILASNGHAAWIDIVEGRIVDAGWSLDKSPPRAVVMAVLDWTQGTFKLSGPARRRETDLSMPITHLLLEQARLRDEASRPVRQFS